jgi:hypothetical protein
MANLTNNTTVLTQIKKALEQAIALGVDSSDATATAEHILKGYSAYTAQGKVWGEGQTYSEAYEEAVRKIKVLGIQANADSVATTNYSEPEDTKMYIISAFTNKMIGNTSYNWEQDVICETDSVDRLHSVVLTNTHPTLKVNVYMHMICNVVDDYTTKSTDFYKCVSILPSSSVTFSEQVDPITNVSYLWITSVEGLVWKEV